MSEGYAIDGDDMHWSVECPSCDKELEYEGFFDPDDKCVCSCGKVFYCNKVWVSESEYLV